MHTPTCFFTLLVTIALAPCAAQTNPKYNVKEDEPRTGSLIRKDLSSSINVAINRTYAELSIEEKARVRANYIDMPETDEPPFPKAGLQALVKPITQGQQKLLVRGVLSLVGIVDPKGQVVEVRSIGSPSPEMTKFASQVMLLTDFKPGICSDKPCTMEFPLYLRFETR